jgi:hypothetical protein
MSPDGPARRFEDWQLADELASSAERCVYDEFTASMNGTAPGPTPLQLEVTHTLRLAARQRLTAALRDIPSSRS